LTRIAGTSLKDTTGFHDGLGREESFLGGFSRFDGGFHPESINSKYDNSERCDSGRNSNDHPSSAGYLNDRLAFNISGVTSVGLKAYI
jgi:hypothetical protein